MLMLRTCKKDGSSYNDYKWNLKIGAENIAEDYNTKQECGGGLHGLPNGIGDGALLDWSSVAIGIVFSCDDNEVVNIDNQKSKCKTAKIEYIGTISECADYIYQITKQQGIVGHIMTGGDYAEMTGGDYAEMTGGYSAKMTGGYSAKMSGGDSAEMTGGNYAKMTGGDYAEMTGGYSAKMTGGYSAKMSGGDSAEMTGGNYAKMTGGDYAEMTGGNYAEMTGGYYAEMTGGINSIIQIKYWDGTRTRIKTGYIGENGLQPNITYRLNNNFEFEEII